MCCYCLAVDPVRMPPVLVLLVLWGGRLWISHPWGGWTRPSTSSPLVPGRALSGTSKPLLSALQMSWSMLPRALPTGICVFWLHLGCFIPSHSMRCEIVLIHGNSCYSYAIKKKDEIERVAKANRWVELVSWCTCTGTFMSPAVVLVLVFTNVRLLETYICGFGFSEQWKLLRNVVVFGAEMRGAWFIEPQFLVIFLFYIVCIMHAHRWFCLWIECCVRCQAVG